MRTLRCLAFFLTITLLNAAPPNQDYELRLHGSTGVSLPLDPKLDVGASYTFMLWVKPDRYATNNLDQVIFGKASDTNNPPVYAFRLALGPNGTLVFGQSNGSSGPSVAGSPTLPLNQWSHVAVTSTGGSIRLYVNGTSRGVASSPGAIPVNGQRITIGAEVKPTGFGAANFAGIVSQVSVWNRGLSAAEVASAVNTRPVGNEAGLVGFWPLDEGRGATFRDRGPGGLTGSYVHGTITPNVNADRRSLGWVGQVLPEWLDAARAEASQQIVKLSPQTSQQPNFGALCTFDLNYDGHPDLLSTGYYDPTSKVEPIVRAYLNDGTGSFTEATQTVFGGAQVIVRSGGCEPADFNNDGLQDLVIVDYGDDQNGPEKGVGRVVLLMHTADGQLHDESAERVGLVTQYAGDAGFGVADLNGDGAPDILFADNNGSNEPSGRYPYRMLINDGTGHFKVDNTRLPAAMLNRNKRTFALIDANEDKFPDLLVDGPDNQYSIYLNDKKGFFLPADPTATPPRRGGNSCANEYHTVFDVNGDKHMDVVYAINCSGYAEGAFGVLLGRGDGTFYDATRQWFPDGLILADTDYADAFEQPADMSVGDLNGDGRPDFAVQIGGTGRNASRVYLNNGTQFVNTPDLFPNMPSTASVVVADFDGDGRPDVAATDRPIWNRSAPTPINPNTIWVTLNKRDLPAAASPATDPLAPKFLRTDIWDDARGGSMLAAPGSRIRIKGENLGPAVPVVFTETSGSLPPTGLGGVQVTFTRNPNQDKVTARLISVSANEILAIVPFALTGSWVSEVQVTYQGRQSAPVAIPVFPIDVQVYGSYQATPVSLTFVVQLADMWKVGSDGSRTKVTTAGQLKWGDRVAFRITGAGPGQGLLTDNDLPSGQTFNPAYPIKVTAGTAQLNVVSLRYGPDGQSGVVEVTVDLPATQPGGSPFLSVTATRFTSNLMTVPINGGPVTPVITVGGIVDAASGSPTLTPGAIASVYGTNLASATVVAPRVPLETSLAGTSVQVNGQDTPLYFVSAGQANFQVPWNVTGSQAAVTVTLSGVKSDPRTATVGTYAPAIFTMNATGQGAIFNAQTYEFAATAGSIPGAAAKPIAKGAFLTIYCIGLGAVSNTPSNGVLNPFAEPLARSVVQPTVTIGGVAATPVLFSGLAPALVGVYQVNVQVPAGAPSGNAVPVVVSIGGINSKPVTIAVQ